MKLSPYAKAILAAAGAALVVLKAALTDGSVDAQEWVDIAIVAGVAAGVWAVPNRPR